MNLLLIGPEIRDINRVNDFSGLWAYSLAREFERRWHNVSFYPAPHTETRSVAQMVADYDALSLDGVNHVLALGVRYLTTIPRECVASLIKRCRGAVMQLHDGPLAIPPCATLTVCADHGMPGCHNIGWAADPDLLVPDQTKTDLTLLVDHPTYDKGETDHSAGIFADIAHFIKMGDWREQYERVSVRRIVDADFEDWHPGDQVKPFHRKHLSYPEACAEYRKAHVFLPTHKEGVGQTVLETAMAGALIVARNGLIPQDRLDTVRRVSYGGSIPWKAVLKAIDPAASRKVAATQTWDRVAGRIIGKLEAWRR